MLNGIYSHENTLLVPFKFIKWSKISFYTEFRYQNGSGESPVGHTKIWKLLYEVRRDPV